MNFIENVKSGVSAAVGTLSDAAQNLIEKNRVNARVNRLKLVIKNESSILNKAYAQLGKYYFENADSPKRDDVTSLFEIISNSKARLKMAQDIYRSIIQKQADEAVAESDPEAEEFVDTITVACSNEDSYGNTEVDCEIKIEETVSPEKDTSETIKEEVSEIIEKSAEPDGEEVQKQEDLAEEAASDENDAF